MVQEIPWGAYTGVAGLAADVRLTPYTLTMACFVRALAGVSDLQEDFVVGTAVLNRGHEELLDVIGMMVATVPVRISASRLGDPVDLAEHIQDQLVWVNDHLPLDQAALGEALGLAGGTRGSALFNVAFSFHDSMPDAVTLGGLRGGMVELHNGSAKFALNVIGIPRPATSIADGRPVDADHLRVLWEYSELHTNCDFVRLLMDGFELELTDLARGHHDASRRAHG